MEGHRRSASLYSSVKVSKGGFSKLSGNTSVMTPFSNIGGEISRYGGKNRTMKQWYEGKQFQGGVRALGFALNKREIGVTQNEIYSQFSATDDICRSSANVTQQDRETYEKLKNNEYLPDITFEKFLAKKVNTGKRTLFSNKGPNENARSFMKEYMQQAAAKAANRAEDQAAALEEERLEN